jgi:hypothetical protein
MINAHPILNIGELVRIVILGTEKGVKSTFDSCEGSLHRFHFPPQAPVVCDPLLHARYRAAHAAVMLKSKGVSYGNSGDTILN